MEILETWGRMRVARESYRCVPSGVYKGRPIAVEGGNFILASNKIRNIQKDHNSSTSILHSG